VNPVLPDEAVEFGGAAAKAFAALGGVDAARRAEDDPSIRATEVRGALLALGIDDLDPRADGDSLAAAAALCEAAGRVALPYPVASTLLRDGDGRPFVVVPDRALRADHGDLVTGWVAAPLHGPAQLAAPAGAPLATRLGPFVTDLAPQAPAAHRASADGTDVDVPLHLALTAASVLGTCDRSVQLAVEHVNDRIQFGKPIASFQAVQFQLADAAVAVGGLRELLHFTLWRLDVDASAALADALALRLHAIDTARAVLRTCQQLHGAAGVCDEYDVSVLARMVQPALRLPSSAERTADELANAVRRSGFEGLFPHGGAHP
jgi:hypothetical protein